MVYFLHGMQALKASSLYPCKHLHSVLWLVLVQTAFIPQDNAPQALMQFPSWQISGIGQSSFTTHWGWTWTGYKKLYHANKIYHNKILQCAKKENTLCALVIASKDSTFRANTSNRFWRLWIYHHTFLRITTWVVECTWVFAWFRYACKLWWTISVNTTFWSFSDNS